MKHRPRQQASGTGVPPVSGPAARRPHAFTLIELLVVISIITVIAGIGVVISGSASRSAAEARTRTLLGQLAGSATEYREQVGNHYTWVRPTAPVIPFGTPYDSEPTMDYLSINRYVIATVFGSRPAFEQLISVNDNSIAGGAFVNIYDDSTPAARPAATAGSQEGYSIVDGFDNPLRYYPGSDNGGTDQTGNGMPLRKRPYFASAGKDGVWGEINAQNDSEGTADTNNDGQPDSKDNLYSFEVQ